jgi:hypothetical protein
MWLHTVQELPSHRVAHLKCDSGIRTAVVWCHNILGLATSVKISGIDVVFGDGPSVVFIEECSSSQTVGALLDPTDGHEPLFKLCGADDEPFLDFESRANLAGYGTRLLLYSGVSKVACRHYAHWIIGRCI